jgi:peptidyl-prolyl cis-trans isomerase A (cyclophilin A)
MNSASNFLNNVVGKNPIVASSALTMFGMLALSSCSRTPPEPLAAEPARVTIPSAAVSAERAVAIAPTSESGNVTTGAAASSVKATVVQKGGNDPLQGVFSLKNATQDLPGTGTLVATIETSKGKLECKLLSEKAPLTVANFVGLARGIRPWKDGDSWIKKPAYDGTIFHRIISGFMIQGGDAKGNGSGEPGYVVPDELWEGAKHDRAGLLCMANRGPNTNGAQFFITDAAAPHLDRSYTIFGECEPVSVVHDIAKVQVDGERPVSPVTITQVKISRVESAKAPAKK